MKVNNRKHIQVDASTGKLLILTSRLTRRFIDIGKGNALYLAIMHAKALARYYKGKGQYIVYKSFEDEYTVVYDKHYEIDESEVLYGVEQNSESGSCTWEQARTFNLGGLTKLS